MASASRDLRSHVTDVVTCPICLELFNSPKSLPCLHTFCLKCIEGHCRDNEPGDEVACPVCRQKFKIPDNGVQGLVSNFFISGLVEARKTARVVVISEPCEVCVDHIDQGVGSVAASTMYCVDCNQKLCEQCSKPHRKWKGGPHKVVPIGSEMETELIQVQGGKCDKHKNKDVELYCLTCVMNICVICFAEEHQHHKCKNVDTVAAEYAKQIDTDIEPIRDRTAELRKQKRLLHAEKRNFLADVEEVGKKILTEGKMLKNLVDRQVDDLLYELQSLKTEKYKEIESHKDRVEMKLLAFETFSTYCSELKSKGKPCDITRAARDLHIRATELLQNDVTLTDYCAPVVTFTSVNIQELIACGQNLVGVVKCEKMTEPKPVSLSLLTEREKTLEQQLAQSVEAERSLRQQIELFNSHLTDNDNTWSQKVSELQAQVKQLNERETEMKADKVKLEKAFNELTVQCELQLRKNERELRLKLENSEKIVKCLERELQQVRTNANDLTVKLDSSQSVVKSLEGQLQKLRISENELKVKLQTFAESAENTQKQREEFNKSERQLKSKLEMSDKSQRMLEKQCEQLKNTERDFRVKLGNSEKAVNSLERELKQLRTSENELKIKLLNSEKRARDVENQQEVLNKSESQLKSNLEVSEKSVKMLEGKCENLVKNEAEMKVKLENSEQARKKLEDQMKQLKGSESETKAKLGKSEVTVKSLNEQLETLRCSENLLKEKVKTATVKEKQLQEQLKQVTDSEQLLKEHLQSVAGVAHALPEAESVWGVTSLDDELYVLRNKSKDCVEVYNTTTTTTTTLYSLVRCLSMPELKSLSDMTSCKHYRCLYISDSSSKCVHRVELNGKVTKWSVNYEPCGLSVTSQFTVIVTCWKESKLLELTTEGKQLREINLQPDIVHPFHAIQLSNGQFVVCHGNVNDPVHRVCIVDTNGHVTQSYGGPRSSATVVQLYVPCHLAADKDGFIFVADMNNRRVLLLSPTLSFVCEIVSRDQLKWDPLRLFLDVDRRRLYVADDEWNDGKYTAGRVVVVQL